MNVFPNLIGGQWLEGGSANPNINPSNLDDLIGQYAQADAAQAHSAIAAARAAFPAWALSGIQQRFDILGKR